MGPIEKQVVKEIASLEKKFSDDVSVPNFRDVNDFFEGLVKSGVAKKRGYNLFSLTDTYFDSAPSFNTETK